MFLIIDEELFKKVLSSFSMNILVYFLPLNRSCVNPECECQSSVFLLQIL